MQRLADGVDAQAEEDAADLVKQQRGAIPEQAEPRDDELNRDQDDQKRHEDENEEQCSEDHFAIGLGFERHGIELEPVIDEAIAEALGDKILDRLDLLVAELDDLAAADIDQMVVVLVGDRLEAGAAILEIVLGDEPGLLEQIEGAIDGRQRNARVAARWRGDTAPRRRDDPRPPRSPGR